MYLHGEAGWHLVHARTGHMISQEYHAVQESAGLVPGGKRRPLEVECLLQSHWGEPRKSKKLSFPRHAESPLLSPQGWQWGRSYSLWHQCSTGTSQCGSGQGQRQP